MTERLVAGMVGGGPGAMIGAAHRHAMWLDNQYVLAAGIFGRDPASSAQFAQSLGVERVYDDHRDMAAFSNFYGDLADMMRGNPRRELSIPTGTDGLIGVQLVEAAIASHTDDAMWVTFP